MKVSHGPIGIGLSGRAAAKAVASSNLALGSIPGRPLARVEEFGFRGPKPLGYLNKIEPQRRSFVRDFDVAAERALRLIDLCGPKCLGYRLKEREVAGSSPAVERKKRNVAQLVERLNA